MSTQKQALEMKCPACSWVRTIEIDVPAGQSEIVKNLGSMQDFINTLNPHWQELIRPLLPEDGLDKPLEWLPMPPCPRCKGRYDFNIYTHATRLA